MKDKKLTINSPDTLQAYLKGIDRPQRQDGVSDQLIDLVKVFDDFLLNSVSDAIILAHPDARKSPSPRYSTLLNGATVDAESLKSASHCGHTISDKSLSVFIANQLGCYDAADWIKIAL